MAGCQQGIPAPGQISTAPGPPKHYKFSIYLLGHEAGLVGFLTQDPPL